MTTRQQLTRDILQAVAENYSIKPDVELSVPDPQFGDFATNVALKISKEVGANPRDIAETIAAKLKEVGHSAEVAGPGFINITLGDAVIIDSLATILEQAESFGTSNTYSGKKVVAEYSDMNAFKTAHAGHLYTTLVGDAIANILETAGAEVHRANFGGDVGLHVGKAMWAIMKEVGGDSVKLADVPKAERSAWVAKLYTAGNTAYETDDVAKQEIIDANKAVYAVHKNNDHESEFAKVYWECRQWSYDGFEEFYERLALHRQADGTYFRYYPESETATKGQALVADGFKKGIFEESDGAIVYAGDKVGLHTRVFQTAQGLPTYEAKDLGLAVQKWEDHHFDSSFIVTAKDITEYMKVVMSALGHFYPEIQQRTRHLTHGLIKLMGGVKMSSRKGNVVLPEEILEATRAATEKASGKAQPDTVLAAIKYSFLKQRLGGDIMYDPEDSVSTTGNSGPYLQYAHARASSILAKCTVANELGGDLEADERTMIVKLSQFTDAMDQAVADLMPHHICTYLYELSQEFNRFYENNRVVGDPREGLRGAIVKAHTLVLKNGLTVLGIVAPEKM